MAKEEQKKGLPMTMKCRRRKGDIFHYSAEIRHKSAKHAVALNPYGYATARCIEVCYKKNC